MSQFQPALDFVLAREGGLVESANDPGGITKCGISLRFLKALDNVTLRRCGINTDAVNINADDVKQLTANQIKALYQGQFWDYAPFEKINSQDCCNFIFDMACDMGIAPAIKCAQRACWAVRQNRGILSDDGILGETTLNYINGANGWLLAAMRSERAGEYRLVAQTNPKENSDLDGWLNRSYNKAT